MGDNLPIASGIFAVGYLIYSWLNPTKEKKPDPLEFEQNNYSRNTPVAIIYGTNKVNCTAIYIGNVYSIYEESDDGGKGGGGSDVEPGYRYYADAAFGLGEGICSGLLNIYVDEFYIKNLDCASSCYTYVFKTGTSSQIVIPEIETYLADKECTAIPWRNTSYLFVSGYSKTYNRVPNITAEINGINLNPETTDWELTDKLSYTDSNPYTFTNLFSFFNLGSKIYCYLVNTNDVIYTKYGHFYAGIYEYDPYNDSFTLICSAADCLGVNITYFHAWFTWRYWDSPTNRMYILVGSGAMATGNYYSLFYIDGDTNTVVSIIKDHKCLSTDWDLYNCYRIDIPLQSGNSNSCHCFVVIHDTLIFAGGRYNGFGFSPQLCMIDLNSGLPGDYVDNFTYEFDPYNYMSYYFSHFEKGEDGLVSTWIRPWSGITYFYKYVQIFINDQLEIFKRNCGSNINGTLEEEGDETFYIKSYEIFTGGSMWYLKLFNLHGTIGSEVWDLSLYKDGCAVYSIYDLNIDFIPYLFITEFKNKIYFEYLGWNGGVNTDIYSYDLNNQSVISECSFSYSNFHILKFYNTNSIFTVKYELSTLRSYEKDSGILSVTPIWALYDFLTNIRYGCGIPSNMVDGDCDTVGTTFYTEHQYCLERITDYNGVYDYRFLYDRVFDQRMKAYDIIADMLQTCRGFLYYDNGLLKVKIQKNNETPVFYLGFHEENFVVADTPESTNELIYVDLSDYPVNYWMGDIGFCYALIDGVSTYVKFLVSSNTTTYLNIEILNIDIEDPTEAPIDSYMKLLLHANGSDNVFVDSIDPPKTVNPIGNVIQKDDQYKFGGKSAYFDGNGDYLSVPHSDDFNFGSDPFTVDFWLRWDGSPNSSALFSSTNGSGYQLKYIFKWYPNILHIHIHSPAYAISSIQFSWTPIGNIWYHLAFTRSGNNWYFFVNGIQTGGTKTNSVVMPDTSTEFTIGGNTENDGGYFKGWIDEFCVSKGIARWTSNFTPYTDEYDIAGGYFVFTPGLNFTLVKDNIKKDSFQFKEKEYGQRFNKIKLSYINRDDNYRTDVIEVEDTYWINKLGEVLEQTYQMDGIKRNSQARRIAQYLLDYESNINWSCSFDTDILGLFFNVGDIVGFTWEQLNWQAKYFRIVSKEEMEFLENKLELLEYIPSVFHDSYCEYAPPNYELIKSRYTVPKHVERLNLFEDYNSNKIYIFFTKSEYDQSFWIGVQCYIKFDDDIEWTNIGILNITSPSAILSSDITISEKSIAFTGMNGSFTNSGSFVIGLEEIGYSYVDTTLKYFYNCERGFNNTDALAHSIYGYISLKQTNTPYYEFSSNNIGKVLYVKLVSVTSYGLTPNEVDLAPMKNITINGYYLLPPKVDNFRITLYSAWYPAYCNVTLGWRCKSKLSNVGYGKDLYGDKYGYGLPTDIEKLILYVYDYPGSGSGGNLARIEEILITNYEEPPTSFIYTDDMNLADHGGSRIYHFEFIIFQKDINGKLSRPSSIDTW